MSGDRDHTIATATVMYAERKGWPLAGVDVTLTYVVKDKNTR